MAESKSSFSPLRFVASIAITEGAGGIGSLLTYESIPTWYSGLVKSPITPPNWLFAPMWVTLFFLMAVALYLVWTGKDNGYKRLAASLFAVQIVLNVLWSFLFFYLHSLIFGAIEIIFLWFFIVATVIEFRPISRTSSYLLFPYLAWVTAATLLNISILWVNSSL